MIEIFNEKFFLKTGYKVTFEPINLQERTIQDKLNWGYELQFKRIINSKDILKLENCIKEYPDIPQFRNYLMMVYIAKGQTSKANKVQAELLTAFPNYFFAKLQEIQLLIKDNIELAIEKMGKPRKIEKFSDEEIFHISQFRSFQQVAAILDVHEEDYDMAKKRANWLRFLEPERKEYREILNKVNAKNSIFAKMAADEAFQKEVHTFPKVKFEQKETHTKLNHETELASFFKTKYDTIPDNYEQILALPKESLIKDLENILLDSCRLNDFYENREEYNQVSESFPFHAAYFLGHLESSNSLTVMLDIFRQGESHLEFWYGDYFNNLYEEVLYKIAKSELEWDLLLDFVMEDNIKCYIKNGVSSVIYKQIISEKMPRAIGLKWFDTVLDYTLNNLSNKNYIDTSFISSLCYDISLAKLTELLPKVEQLCELNLVLSSISGDFKSLKELADEPVEQIDLQIEYTSITHFYKPPFHDYTPSLADLKKPIDDDMFLPEELGIDGIEELLANFSGIFDDLGDNEKEVRLASPQHETFVNTEKKVGRNEPCPCGSGKKYKKCHGKK